MANEPLKVITTLPTARFALTHKATVYVHAPTVDNGDVAAGTAQVEVGVDDPALTAQQRTTLTNLVTQILRFKGVIT